MLPPASILRAIPSHANLEMLTVRAITALNFKRRQSMFTTHAFRCLVLATGLATITSAVAFAKTHEVCMTAVESDVVIDGSGEK